MQRLRTGLTLSLLFGLIVSMTASATMVQQLNLGEMTTNADKIFRATIVSVRNGTITAGGGQLQTVTYVVRVSDTLKGNTSSPNGKAGNMLEITMLGRIKAPPSQGDIRFAGGFQPPLLLIGSEYLLFTTAPSSLGLSMTVGRGQGAFQFVLGDHVINEAKNAGLFRDMSAADMPSRGPIAYTAIAARINSLLGQ